MLTSMQSRSIALARGFIVFLIAPIHCVMVYSTPQVKSGLLGRFMSFFAEYPGAHLFMFLMGLFIALSSEKKSSYIFKRSLLLLLVGYLLNAGKFVIPYSLDLLPKTFYSSNHITNDDLIVYRLLLINDILHLAAVAYFICGIIRKTRYAPLISILLALATLILSPLLWNKGDTNDLFLNALLDLAGGCPPKAYFPVLPWIFHPLLGMVYGFGIKRYTISSRYLFVLGTIFCLTGFCIAHYEPPEYQLTFFRSGPGDTLLHAGTTLIFISILDIATNRIKTTTILNFFTWCSAHITMIYLVQWIIVMWLLSITGYETLNNIQSFIMIITVNTLTMLLVNHLTRSKNKTDES